MVDAPVSADRRRLPQSPAWNPLTLRTSGSSPDVPTASSGTYETSAKARLMDSAVSLTASSLGNVRRSALNGSARTGPS